MSETTQAQLNRCYYRSIGQMLTTDVLRVEYGVDGNNYKQDLPNSGWHANVPALQFFGFLEMKPSDMNGQEMTFDNREITVAWNERRKKYAIPNMIFAVGKKSLQEAEWFNPNGNVWNSGSNMGAGGMSVDPSTGNRGAVEITDNDES